MSYETPLIKRLRGEYGVGPANAGGDPEMGYRTFQVPPINIEAADEIARLTAELAAMRERCGSRRSSDAASATNQPTGAKTTRCTRWRGMARCVRRATTDTRSKHMEPPMDTDLLTVSRALAERGWLPGIYWQDRDETIRSVEQNHWCCGEADLLLAAARQVREINGTVLFGEQWVKLMVHDPKGIRMAKTYDEPTKQGETLALLRCLLAAWRKAKGMDG